MTAPRETSKLLGFLLLALAVGVAWFVPQSGGEPPQDDAYISYIYARNFARGEGLVFNAGEPAVEGYTNYLWTIAIGWGYRFGIDPEQLAPLIGHLLTLLTVMLVFLYARRMGSTHWFAALGALLFATRPTLVTHAVGGMETPLFGLLMLVALLLRQGRGGGLGRQWAGSTVIALAALTRPEGVLLYGLLELSALWETLRAKLPLVGFVRDALLRSLPFLLIVGTHVAWRHATYGDFVPNTFHAKVSPGLQTWSDGWAYVSSGLLYFGPLFLLLPYFVRFEEAYASDRRRALWIATVFTIYVVYVGGDYIPSFRFLWPMMPIWSALIAVALTRLCAVRSYRTVAASALFAVLLALHTTHEYRTARQWQGLEVRHRQLITSGKLLDRILPEDSWIAVTAAGRLPYYADRKTLDMMGLSDAHIGKRSVMKKTSELAGHLKGDGKYVLDCEPDLIVFLNLFVGSSPLAERLDWRQVAKQGAFGVSERELVEDPRFFREYGMYSLPLGGPNSWLNVMARDGAFGEALPPGTRVSPPLID